MEEMTQLQDMLEEETVVENEELTEEKNQVTDSPALTKKRWILYVALTFVLTYVYEFAVIHPLTKGKLFSGLDATILTTVTQILVSAAMFFPAIGVLITRLVTKEGFRNAMLMPHFKGNIKFYLMGYFGPAILTLIGAVVYFLIYPEQFDANCGYLVNTYKAMNVDMSTMPMSLPQLLAIQSVQALFMGPLMNFVNCFGEEWGWRGYMVPKMAEGMKTVPMLLLSGVIWGLWHAPLTAAGHNYGMGYAGFPFTGIAAMCGFCIVLGIFLSFITLKTKSCIPAILAHGSVNSIASVGIYFTTDGGNPFIGPAPTGVIGAIAFIIVDIIILVYWLRKKEL